MKQVIPSAPELRETPTKKEITNMRRFTCRVGLPLALLASIVVFAGSAGAASADPVWLPSGGAFVIGDGNASIGSQVTFWGAKWAKENSVSGGNSPAAFKGFALSSTACGSFTTDPGNSAPPPDGPLPASMYVLVTSSVVKSGSTITGTVVGVAVVATDDGYSSNPGHAGTGTVTGFTPCGGGE